MDVMFYGCHVLWMSCFMDVMFYGCHVLWMSCFMDVMFYGCHVLWMSCFMDVMFYGCHVPMQYIAVISWVVYQDIDVSELKHCLLRRCRI